jgi:hypothetical protein
MKKVVIKEVYWEIPSSVDLKGFLEKYPPTFVARPKIDYFYSIIEHLSIGMDEQDLDANAGFINMNAERMQKFNHNYKLYLEHLLKHGFIRTDMKYIPGIKSKAYLLDDYKKHQAKVARIPVTDFVIRKKKRAELEIGQKNNQVCHQGKTTYMTNIRHGTIDLVLCQ